MKRRSVIALLILGGDSMRKLFNIVFSAVLLLIGSTTDLGSKTQRL